MSIVLYFNILACAKGLKSSVLTNSLSGIQHAWHFWYAVVSVLKCYAATSALRASPLNWALCDRAKFLVFFTFVVFGHSLFGVGKSALSTQVLESLKP